MTDGSDVFRLPDLGEGLTEAEIVAWLVEAGTRVVRDQPLVTVETDKAVIDIPSPRSGVVAACLGAVGDIKQVGEPLLRFAAEDARTDAGAVVGRLPEAPSAPAPAPSTKRAPATVRASPRARRRARELGVDLAGLTGTGPGGVIEVRDVERSTDGGDRLSPVRRAMSARMTDAARVVRATVTGEADVSRWSASGSPMGRLIRALASAVTAEPRLNAWFDDRAERLDIRPVVDLGIAMETDDGLFVPVLRDAGSRSAEVLAAELEVLEAAVRDRRIRPEAMRGQTITLSNFGAVGGLHAEMVVVPPQVAIVGAGRSFGRLVGTDGGTTTARILPLSLSVDHRVVTGVEACRFLNALIEDLERAD
ncbi:MAG: dihydrolipoamide acetyltransferase family protein [Pseudomonadales bacterium]|jgi:pyruvate dehydrogenase E2 component (dihydrolipoamide acetyltransferase)